MGLQSPIYEGIPMNQVNFRPFQGKSIWIFGMRATPPPICKGLAIIELGDFGPPDTIHDNVERRGASRGERQYYLVEKVVGV